MATIVIENLEIPQTLEKQAMRRIRGGLCLDGQRCGPADGPLSEKRSPFDGVDLFNGKSVFDYGRQWKLDKIPGLPVFPENDSRLMVQSSSKVWNG